MLVTKTYRMKIPVFRKGTWIEYEPPREVPSGWQSFHSYQAASIFATAHALGYSVKASASLAEICIFKQIFEGIVYDSKLEAQLQAVLNHGGTASDPIEPEKREMCEQKIQ
jgi:hypothetical protein